MSEKSAERYLIIHGHFYQPPREDPWSGVVDRQDSAYPAHDWNTRVHQECYAANTDARTLDSSGRIHEIVNNYAYISYNFGPTLLSWMEEHDPEAYGKILEADRLSIERTGGYGNAMAQVYNHAIMPLCNERDKYTQVRWGLSDFKSRFGRDADGIWLAETAVNLDTATVLADCGVRFIVLSPTQVEAFREAGSEEWVDVSENSIDTSRPYRISTPRGELSVFFYNMDISRSVGFEHLLNSSENFRNRILSAYSDEATYKMVNIATDGETYGHHEPFANMCLASLVSDNSAGGHFVMSNYSHFLSLFPPTAEVRLKEGNNGLGTAWSCAHGVGRWMEDCGCSSGGGPGWHQKWRAPFRNALDFLRDRMAGAGETAGKGLLKDFWAARDAYISVLLAGSEEGFNAFLGEHAVRILSAEERGKVRVLMEAQKYAMFMYTSCGWFFSEISGIETVQCMRYAARALEFCREIIQEDTEEGFLELLSHAVSNIPAYGNGRKVYEDCVLAHVMDGAAVINQYVLERLLSGEQASDRMYCYKISISNIKSVKKEGGRIYSGTAQFFNQVTRSSGKYIFYLIRKSRLDIRSWIKPYEDERMREFLDLTVSESPLSELERKMADWFIRSYTMDDLKFDYKEKLIGELFKSSFLKLHEVRTVALDGYLEMLDYYARMHIPIPEVERSGIEATLNNEIRRRLALLEEGGEIDDFGFVAKILSAAKATHLNVNRSTIEALFALKIGQYLDMFLQLKDEANFIQLIRLIEFANSSSLDFNRKRMENRVFSLLREVFAPGALPGAFEERIVRLAGSLNIQVGGYRKLIRKPLQAHG